MSVRTNGLADGKLPRLPPVLRLTLDAVYVPTSGPCSQVSIKNKKKDAKDQSTHGLSSSSVSRSSQQSARIPSPSKSRVQVYREFPASARITERSHDQLTRYCPVHLTPPSRHPSFQVPSISPLVPRVHFPWPLEHPPRCLSP